jgi:hypothetical protein
MENLLTVAVKGKGRDVVIKHLNTNLLWNKELGQEESNVDPTPTHHTLQYNS